MAVAVVTTAVVLSPCELLARAAGNVASPKLAAATPEKRPVDKKQPAGDEPQVLDLFDLQSADAETQQQTEQQLLQAPDKPAAPQLDFGGGLQFDLGSDELDFGEELLELRLDDVQEVTRERERERYESAVDMMADQEFAAAAPEFRSFIDDRAFAQFHDDSQYQLAKALYRMGFLTAALTRFQTILAQGPSHARYRKSIEWLFFVSRKTVDETPVLAELARFRNVTFPKAYRDEYRYLLSKYLFVQAQKLEVQRIKQEEVQRAKQAKGASLDFSAVTDAIESQGSTWDFADLASELEVGLDVDAQVDGGAGFDFGAASDTDSKPSDSKPSDSKPSDSKPSDSKPSDSKPSDSKPSGGGLDFGAGADAGADAGFDFGAAPGGGLDFGGTVETPRQAGGFDFGGSAVSATEAGRAPAPGPAVAVAVAVAVNAAPQTSEEAIAQGLGLASEVVEQSAFYPRAKYLAGLLQYLRGDAQHAVEAFQEVVRVLHPRDGLYQDAALRELAFLSLARIHYEHEQFDRSVYYYDQIDRDSENWLTALFEASWAYYRRGDFEKALGNLLTLNSPFFEYAYFPEGQLVRAIIYFEACRYGETREFIDAFLHKYTRVLKELQRIVESTQAPELLYERIRQLEQDAGARGHDVTARVVNLTLSDPEIRTALDVVAELEDQLKKLNGMPEAFRAHELGVELYSELGAELLRCTKQAGEVTRGKFEQEIYELKSLLAQALRIKIEVTRSERQLLETTLRGEAAGGEVIPAEHRLLVDDEHVYWPYEGEYWRDELGSYQIDFGMCRPGDAR